MTTTNPNGDSPSRMAAGARDPEPTRPTENRDCGRCGRPIAADETVCIYGRAGNADYDRPCCDDCVADQVRRFRKEGKDAAADYHERWLGKPCPCEVCGRPLRAYPDVTVCSYECRKGKRAARRRKWRQEVSSQPIPDSVTCKACGSEVGHDAIIVARDGRYGGDLCGPCYTAERRKDDADQIANPGPFAGLFDVKDPAGPDWTPWRKWMTQLAEETGGKCGWCGRALMGDRYCCERCEYEGDKAKRRVQPQEKACVVCGDTFVPKRSDAKTCSPRCRQRLRRSQIAEARRGASATTRTEP